MDALRVTGKCGHCPVSGRGDCAGQSAARICQLADPSHPDHNPLYRRELIRRAGYPSLAQQARNFARSLWGWATDWFRLASRAEVARRMEICSDCPNFDAGRCRLCGCQLAAKVRMRSGHCPVEKW